MAATRPLPTNLRGRKNYNGTTTMILDQKSLGPPLIPSPVPKYTVRSGEGVNRAVLAEEANDGVSGQIGCSSRHGHPHFHHPKLGAFHPRAIRDLSVAHEFPVITNAAENLAVVVKANSPDRRSMTVQLR